jgi:tight adherence protein B
MIGLAEGLLGLAAVCAHRASRAARRARALAFLVPTATSPPRAAIPWCSLGAVALWGLVGWVVAGPAGLLAAGPSFAIGRRLRRRATSRRATAALAEQLVDAVGALASAVRAGRSTPQAIGSAADEVGEPLATSLRDLEAALGSGEPFDGAVRDWVVAIGTDDAALAGATLSLHHRMGGDLAAGLDRVATMLRERAGVAAEIRSMTAQARLSGLIVGSLPIAFLGVLWLVSRDDVVRGLSHPAGQAAVIVGLVLEAGAFLWIRRLLEGP